MCYYQKILVENIELSVIDITNINLGAYGTYLLVENTALLSSFVDGDTYDVYISVGNINDISPVSYNYNHLTFNQDDVNIQTTVSQNTINTNQLYGLIESFTTNNIELIKYSYLQNYIPLDINNYNKTCVQKLLEINTIGKVLLQEITQDKTIIQPRRGDRVEEKFLSSNESIEKYIFNDSIIKIKNTHDK